MQPLAQLAVVVIAVRPPPAGDHGAGRGHAGEACEADELPGHAHGERVAYAP
jgi:hypothetical protein